MIQIYNQDCIEGCQSHIESESIDLIITDPPFGIKGDTLHKHYNRKEDFVIDGYVEVPIEQYYYFSCQWITEAERILRPGGSMYIVSGYTNLIYILNALKNTGLEERNHIIWKYNFGVYTEKKYVSSHYHILYWVKPGGNITFNTNCRYHQDDRDNNHRSLCYRDMEDVWVINREYKSGIKNKNQLPEKLLEKMIAYSSNEKDLILDFFAGSFSTIEVSHWMDRNAIGFEVNENAFRFYKNLCLFRGDL